MEHKVPEFLAYIKDLKGSIDAIKEADIRLIADLMVKTRDQGGTIYICGNGDSASNAVHFAADFDKGTMVEGSRKRFRVHSLTVNVPLMTAWANDTSYEMIFKEQLVDILRKEDLVIGISGSGNSPNILRAIEYANEVGAETIGLCGFDGGKLAKTAKHPIIARVDNMEITEDIHWIIGHLVKVELLGRFMKERGG